MQCATQGLPRATSTKDYNNDNSVRSIVDRQMDERKKQEKKQQQQEQRSPLSRLHTFRDI